MSIYRDERERQRERAKLSKIFMYQNQVHISYQVYRLHLFIIFMGKLNYIEHSPFSMNIFPRRGENKL